MTRPPADSPYHGASDQRMVAAPVFEPDGVPFASLCQFAAQAVRKPPIVPAERLADVFAERLQDAAVVSFDVFDTLVVRRVHRPVEVFLHLELPSLGHVRPGHEKASASSPRRLAEHQARQALFASTGSGEVTLTEIYEALCAIAQIPKDRAPGLAVAEEEVELKLCLANPVLGEMVQVAEAQGKRVVFVSDTYHHRAFVARLLEHHGFAVTSESLFVSSDYRVNKRSGQLFHEMLKQIGVPAAKVLHVGDDPVSDYQQPRKLGMHALLHPHRASADETVDAAAMVGAPLPAYVRGVCSIESHCHWPERDFWWLLGHNVFGPLFTGFCSWLERRFREDGIEQAWFLLRDGEVFQRVFAALFDSGRVGLGTLPASRRAYLLPVFGMAPELALDGLLAGVERRPVREFLSRLRLPVEAFAQEFAGSGFASADEVIDGRAEGQRLHCLLRRPRVNDALLEQSRQERELLRQFLDQEGVVADRKVALVELGWTGSIQKAVQLLLARDGHKPNLTGYYLATRATFSRRQVAGLQFHSYVMHLGRPGGIARALGFFPELLEVVCSSASGSLLHFERQGEQIKGVFQAPDTSAEQRHHLAMIHDGAVSFAQEFRRQRAKFGFTPMAPLVAAENFFRLLANPTKEEAVRIGSLTHSDNVGSLTRRYCARFRSSVELASLMDDYQRAYWKQGLLAQPTVHAATVRTVLWLMQK